MRKVVIALSCLYLMACAAQATREVVPLDYHAAINEAEVQMLDRRPDLRVCVGKLSWKREVRNALMSEILDSTNQLKNDSVLLEITSRGALRYDYVYVQNAKLISSYEGARELDVSNTTLQKYLEAVSQRELEGLVGRAYSDADDAPCYFLSIKKGSSSKSVAVFGSLRTSAADSLIKELLALVQN